MIREICSPFSIRSSQNSKTSATPLPRAPPKYRLLPFHPSHLHSCASSSFTFNCSCCATSGRHHGRGRREECQRVSCCYGLKGCGRSKERWRICRCELCEQLQPVATSRTTANEAPVYSQFTNHVPFLTLSHLGHRFERHRNGRCQTETIFYLPRAALVASLVHNPPFPRHLHVTLSTYTPHASSTLRASRPAHSTQCVSSLLFAPSRCLSRPLHERHARP